MKNNHDRNRVEKEAPQDRPIKKPSKTKKCPACGHRMWLQSGLVEPYYFCNKCGRIVEFQGEPVPTVLDKLVDDMVEAQKYERDSRFVDY